MKLTLAAALVVIGSVAQAQPASLLGTLDFPTSAGPEAQEAFEQGMLATHSFWWAEARDHFRRAKALDPDFAMAYWGEALTYHDPGPPQEDMSASNAAARAVLSDLDAREAVRWTDRERAYVDAMRPLYAERTGLGERRSAHADAMRRLAARYPDDSEAAILAARAQLSAGLSRPDADPTDPAFVVPIAAILEEAFARNPDHPGAAHYLIHLYDTPTFAPLGVRPALAYARIAPASSHALHMPSHIFRALGMWDEMAASNRDAYDASITWQEQTDRPLSARDSHALDWLVDAYLKTGRYAEAHRVADLLRGLLADASSRGEPLGYLPMTQISVETRLYDAEAWAGLAPEPPGVPAGLDVGTLPPGPHLADLGLRAAAAGQDTIATTIRDLIDGFVESPAVGPFRPFLIASAHAIEAERLQARGDTDGALAASQMAAESIGADVLGVERGAYRARYASRLLAQGDARAAHAHFAALAQTYPRTPAFEVGAARAAAALGDTATSLEHYRAFLSIWKSADADLPILGEGRRFIEAN